MWSPPAMACEQNSSDYPSDSGESQRGYPRAPNRPGSIAHRRSRSRALGKNVESDLLARDSVSNASPGTKDQGSDTPPCHWSSSPFRKLRMPSSSPTATSFFPPAFAAVVAKASVRRLTWTMKKKKRTVRKCKRERGRPGSAGVLRGDPGHVRLVAGDNCLQPRSHRHCTTGSVSTDRGGAIRKYAHRARPAPKPNSRRRIASKTLNCSPASAYVAGSFALPSNSHAGANVASSRASASSSLARRDGEREETRRRFFVRRSACSSASLDPSISSRRSICASPSSTRSGDVAQVLDDALAPAVGASLPKRAGDAGEVSALDDGEVGRMRKASERLVWR